MAGGELRKQDISFLAELIGPMDVAQSDQVIEMSWGYRQVDTIEGIRRLGRTAE
jgi:hypothetical protein